MGGGLDAGFENGDPELCLDDSGKEERERKKNEINGGKRLKQVWLKFVDT